MEVSYVEKRTVFETVIGSRAYGINNENSDYDKAGVMIPGLEYLYGNTRFDQFQGYLDEDKTIYNIRKALKLIAENNPNMMDLLWVPERCWIKITPYWQAIMEQRGIFVSKRCKHTFSGYAIAQLDRIRVHRKFLLNPPKEPPSRSELRLPEASIFPTAQLKAVCYAALEFIADEDRKNLIDELDGIYGDYIVPLFSRYLSEKERAVAMEWFQMGIKAQAKTFQTLGAQYLKEEYVDLAHKELLHYTASREWERYQQWKKSRNKERAPLEEMFGYDTKHAAHLVRLIRMCKEIMETGIVMVDRTGIDADELKAIRAGAWTYDQIEEYAHSMDDVFDELYKTSKLPRSVDPDKINQLCVDTIDLFFKENPTLKTSLA